MAPDTIASQRVNPFDFHLVASLLWQRYSSRHGLFHVAAQLLAGSTESNFRIVSIAFVYGLYIYSIAILKLRDT